MIESPLCVCGHPKRKHTGQGCLHFTYDKLDTDGPSFMCPCRQFSPEQQSSRSTGRVHVHDLEEDQEVWVRARYHGERPGAGKYPLAVAHPDSQPEEVGYGEGHGGYLKWYVTADDIRLDAPPVKYEPPCVCGHPEDDRYHTTTCPKFAPAKNDALDLCVCGHPRFAHTHSQGCRQVEDADPSSRGLSACTCPKFRSERRLPARDISMRDAYKGAEEPESSPPSDSDPPKGQDPSPSFPRSKVDPLFCFSPRRRVKSRRDYIKRYPAKGVEANVQDHRFILLAEAIEELYENLEELQSHLIHHLSTDHKR